MPIGASNTHDACTHAPKRRQIWSVGKTETQQQTTGTSQFGFAQLVLQKGRRKNAAAINHHTCVQNATQYIYSGGNMIAHVAFRSALCNWFPSWENCP